MQRDPRITPRVPLAVWSVNRRILVGGYQTTNHDSKDPPTYKAGWVSPVATVKWIEVAP